MKKTILLLALFGLIAVMTGCTKAEEITVNKYFEAMKHNDKDTMASMAIEPVDIEYKKFEIVSLDEPVVNELELPALKKKLEDLKKSQKEQVEEALDKQYAMEDLQDELDDTRRRAKKKELEGKIEEAKAEMEAEKGKVYLIVKDINKTKKRISREKSLIETSTGIGGQTLDLYTGETHLLKANVKITLADGTDADYVFLLCKYVLKMGESNPRSGRLIITKIATVADYEKEMQEGEAEDDTATTEEVSEETPAEDAAVAAPEGEQKEEPKEEEKK